METGEEMSLPLYIENEMIIYIDCDDTLVMHNVKGEKITFSDPYSLEKISLTPHKRHIKLLKDFKARGYSIVVWSAAGAIWAKEVVTKLELLDYVDLMISKPLKFIDDLPATEILGARIYIQYLEE